ncbi:MAG: insulinase family protein [Gammaproteobacteria bacterium]|nr:insulinase family protein [Gammaproteobacteria bacterium]
MTGQSLKRVANYFVIIFIALYASAAAASEDPNVTEAVLDNGMKILIKQDHRAPVVVAQVWYRIGSSYEPEGITGVSHVLEHMMFKGTKRHGKGEFNRIIAENGGRDNAFTGRDYTAYFQTLEKSRLPISMALESDRMRGILLDEKEFAKELQVVIEERRMRTEDKPESKVYEKFNEAAFPGHPYGRPVIGWMRDLKKLDVRDLQKWYQRYYSPANAILVVVGDVDPDEVISMAKKYYGPIKSSKVEVPQQFKVAKQVATKRITVKAPANLPYIILGFHVPAVADKPEHDWEPYALELLSAILDGGSAARFADQLIRGQQVATTVSTSYDPFVRLAGYFLIDGNPARGTGIAQLEKAILEQLEQLKEKPVSDKELQRVKAQVIAANVYERDSVFYQGMKLGLLETTLNDWRLTENHVKRLRAVTAGQIMAVAKKYFLPENMTVAVLDPQPIAKGKPTITPASKEQQNAN